MSKPIDHQIRLLASGSNHLLLDDWMKAELVTELAPNEARVATVPAGQQYVLVDSSMQAGKIAVNTTTDVDDSAAWYMTAQLAGAVGTADIASIQDGYGTTLNLCPIRIAGTHKAIRTVTGERVHALLQSDSGAADGDAIGAAAAENVQLSFFYVDPATGTFTLTSLNAAAAVDIEFGIPVVRRLADMLDIEKIGGTDPGAVDSQSLYEPRARMFDVTSTFAAGETFDLITGAGSATGTSTIPATGHGSDTIDDIDSTAASFNDNDEIEVFRNGVLQEKGEDVIWNSATTFSFNDQIEVGEDILVKRVSLEGDAFSAGNLAYATTAYVDNQFDATLQQEIFTLAAGDITAKQVTLANAPTAASVAVNFASGGTATSGNGVNVAGSAVSWSGEALDGILAAGDVLVVTYYKA